MKSFTLKDENGKFYYGWVIVLVAGLLCGLVYSGIVSVTGIFLLPVTMELELPIGGYSFYLTIMSIANMLTLLVISKFLNEKNIKKIMIAAAICGVISFIGFAMAKSLLWFYIFAVPQGFCMGAFTMTPAQILVSNWFGEKVRGRAMSIFLAIMSVITVILMNVLNRVVLTMGWSRGYMVLAVCVAVCGVVAACTIVWSPVQKGVKRIGDLDESELATMAGREIKGTSFLTAIKKPVTWLAFISTTLAVIVSSSILQHGIATIVMSGKMDQTAATGLVSTMSLIMIITGPIVGVVCDEFRLQVAAVGTSLFFAMAVFGLAFVGSSWGIPAFVLGYMFGVPAINIISPLIMSYMYGEKDLGKLISYVNVFVAVGGAIGAAAVGALVQAYGTYFMPWIIMTVVLLAVAVIRGVCTAKGRRFNPETDAE